ncbi:MAG TPA: YcxB family protein [Gammaproteobacteria bacterium]|nr:YcxB family protein [Gammaproteobacteria bacterium]
MTTIQLTERDLVDAYLLAKRWGKGMWSMYAASTAVYVGLGLWLLTFPRVLRPFGIAALVFAAVSWILAAAGRYVLIPIVAKRRFRASKALARPFRLDWNEDGLEIESAIGIARPPWSDFRKWRENGRLFLVYSPTGVARILPKASFPNRSGAEEFRSLLERKLGPSR